MAKIGLPRLMISTEPLGNRYPASSNYGEQIMTGAVHKIKFFSGFQQDFATLENEINQWLADNSHVQILHMTQSEISSKQGRDIVVTFLFQESLDS
jgi:hypothetical protein